jgi:hypothetical protein
MSAKKIKTEAETLTKKHQSLIHSIDKKVLSHVQREQNDWLINTLMIEDCSTPFKFKRKKSYRNLKGARVNLTYYTDKEIVAGMAFEVMNVVRIRVA